MSDWHLHAEEEERARQHARSEQRADKSCLRLSLALSAADHAAEPLESAAAALARRDAERRLRHIESTHEHIRLALQHLGCLSGHDVSRLAALLVEGGGIAAGMGAALLVEHPELREQGPEVPW